MPRTKGNAPATGQTSRAIQFDRIATAADLATEAVLPRDVGGLALLDTGAVMQLQSVTSDVLPKGFVGNWVGVSGASVTVNADPTTLSLFESGNVLVDLASGTVVLPDGPFDGLEYTFVDIDGGGGHTIGQSAIPENINGAASDFAFTLALSSVTMRFIATRGWYVTGYSFGTLAQSALT